MTRASQKRLGRLRQAIDASPVRRHLLREAYEWFTSFGELPDDDHLAFEVVRQALRGGEEAPLDDEPTVARQAKQARLAYHQKQRPASRWPPSVRSLLFDEALFEQPPLRKIARAAIALEVARGGDVENEAFAARHGIPGYGSVAMHVLGWPGKLAAAPFEEQANRLFVRLDRFRGEINHDDPGWLDAQGRAIEAFWKNGELPADDLHLDGVLINVELDLLASHRHGKDVAESMAVMDRLAHAQGDEVEGLLEKLSGLARAGKLL